MIMKTHHVMQVHLFFLLQYYFCESFTLMNKPSTYARHLQLNAEKMNNKDDINAKSSRREFIQKSVMTSSSYAMLSQIPFLAGSNNANAADDTEDLTQKLYNPDGSLKDDQNNKVTYDSISIDLYNQLSGTYSIPSPWTKDNTYTDTTTNTKVCNAISIFPTPTKANLKKAATVGVAKELQLDKSFIKSDLVSAKKRYIVLNSNDVQEELEVYDFDLAVAPSTCNENAKENLGLGFCPYEDIVLVSAINYNENTYVFQLECNREQWMKFNADLKDVRRSFTLAMK